MEGVAAWQETGGASRYIGMLGLGKELGTSRYTEPSVSVVWAMRVFLLGVGASSIPLSVPS